MTEWSITNYPGGYPPLQMSFMKNYLLISIIILMPGPLLAPAIIAGSSLFTEGMNAMFTSQNNRKSRQWNEKMYSRQRADALSDWTMQNEYNSPRAQMQRLRDAGLNPNLVYGNGSATTTAQAPRSTDMDSWNPTPPQVSSSGISSSLMSYYDIKMKEAGIDNLVAQNTVAVQEALLKAAQVLSTTTSTKSTAFDLSMKESLKETSLEAARVGLDKLKAETSTSLTQAEVAAASKTSSIEKAVEEVLNMRLTGKTLQQALQNLRLDEHVKAFQARLADQNINPSDPLWARMVSLLIDRVTKGGFKFNAPDWINPFGKSGERYHTIEQNRKMDSTLRSGKYPRLLKSWDKK